MDLYQALSAATQLPIHLHSHSTSGLASMCFFQAIQAGCQHIDTAISSFAGGASHPATESMVAALAGTEYDTGLALDLLLEIGDYFHNIRKKYRQFENETRRIDPRVQLYQVPGGMISNLYNQLKEQQALDKLEEVQREIPRVRKDLGYPPLVTPTSQTYAMFPKIGKQFLSERENNTLMPEPLEDHGNAEKSTLASEFDIALHGEHYQVKVAGLGS